MGLKKYQGFTLIEILVVVALIAILAAITIIAINPAKNFADARNATRNADVTTILNAMSQYIADAGAFGADASGATVIPTCPTTVEIGTTAANYDINDGGRLVPTYIVAVPFDPQGGTAGDTGYSVCQSAAGRYQVSAVGENSATISVQR